MSFGDVKRHIRVPTGDIIAVKGYHGILETVSVGDYGKEVNVKADFLGLNRDINGVPNGPILSLEEKWVITVSTQYGCAMKCKFCDAPKVGKGENATVSDLRMQIEAAIKLHPEIKKTKRLNVHYARMGEPTFNMNVLSNALDLDLIVEQILPGSKTHPVISTMMPKKNKSLYEFLNQWCKIKNNSYEGNAGLQISINSTNEKQRHDMFAGQSLTLEEISDLFSWLPYPVGRKYTLNFALADGYEIDAAKLKSLFNPKHFLVKLTPLHATQACEDHNIQTTGGYEYFTPYRRVEEELKNAGFDVIVFVPSWDEDLGRITCGNVILSGTMPLSKYEVVV